MSWIRFCAKTHNYLGLVLSLFFLLLFGSGIIMMFVGYPRYYDTHRLPDLPPVDTAAVNVTAGEAYRRSGLISAPQALRLNMLQGRSVYRFQDGDGSHRMVFADNGETVGEVDEAMARRSVDSFMAVNGITGEPRGLGRMRDVDAWTTNPGFSGTPHWPLYKYQLGDADGTQLYVSSDTAEVVHKTDRQQRFWGYLGPVIHYFYVPFDIRQFPDTWFAVVVVISGLGSVVCALGLLVGVIYFRWKQLGRWLAQWLPGRSRAPDRRMLPFRGWLYWHNLLGMLFGVLAFTWIFSGMMSMNPLGLESSAPSAAERSRWSGGGLALEDMNTGFREALRACQQEIDVREIRLRQLAGTPFHYCLESAETTRIVTGAGSDGLREHFPAARLAEHVQALMQGSEVIATRWLDSYDAYYRQGRPERIGDQVKRLPVLRARMDDSARTWFYIDPYSGSLAARFQTESRVNRWVFNGLHTLDFGWLHEHRRALWWTVMFVFMLGGLALSAIGVWLSGLWLGRNAFGRGGRRRARP